jgi:hypothetical protein
LANLDSRDGTPTGAARVAGSNGCFFRWTPPLFPGNPLASFEYFPELPERGFTARVLQTE